jgi:hypothetical protein
MSINLGNDAMLAIHELRNNPHFETLVSAFGAYAQSQMLRALGHENRLDATGYARGVYEVWVAMHATYTGQHQAQVKPPPLNRSKNNNATSEPAHA